MKHLYVRKDCYISHKVWTFKRSDGLTKQYVKKANGKTEIWIMEVDCHGIINVCEYRYNGKIYVWNY